MVEGLFGSDSGGLVASVGAGAGEGDAEAAGDQPGNHVGGQSEPHRVFLRADGGGGLASVGHHDCEGARPELLHGEDCSLRDVLDVGICLGHVVEEKGERKIARPSLDLVDEVYSLWQARIADEAVDSVCRQDDEAAGLDGAGRAANDLRVGLLRVHLDHFGFHCRHGPSPPTPGDHDALDARVVEQDFDVAQPGLLQELRRRAGLTCAHFERGERTIA